MDKEKLESLSAMYPLSDLPRFEMLMLSHKTPTQIARKRQTILERGSTEDVSLFLLKGSVYLIPADGQKILVEAGSEKALRPISHLVPHQYDVIANSQVQYVRIENRIIDNLLEEHYHASDNLENVDIPLEVTSIPLFQRVYAAIANDEVELPVLPNIAVRILDVMHDENIALRDIEHILQADLSLATLIVKTANSALFRLGQPVKTLEQAIIVLGTKLVKNLILVLSARPLFVNKTKVIKDMLKIAWQHSVEVGAVAYALAEELPQFDPNQALLCGLIHDIGMVPLLNHARKFPRLLTSRTELEVLNRQLHGLVGELLLTKWNFPQEFIDVCRNADDWFRDHHGNADYSDLIIIAQLHTFIGKNKDRVSPLTGNEHPIRLDQVPAFQRLGLAASGPDHSMELISHAQIKIKEIRQLLSI